MSRVGIIGGSGLYDIEGITDVERVEVETPFG
ncbi:MAG: S-methyl-5'-thioadenosine phosphorylase, partial [Planctomycetota bacterium]